MRVLFDVSHPAHVHLFRHAIKQLSSDGHQIAVTSREKDLTTDLLDAYDIEHTPISTKGEGMVSLAVEWMIREARMMRVAVSFEPDVIVSRLNPPAVHASMSARCPSIVFDDSEVVRFAGKITHPFADVICTPANFDRDLGPKQRRYEGFHELAYLHPNRFEPKRSLLTNNGINPDESYSVLRFVSWGAHHDIAHQGFSTAAKRDLVSGLSDNGEVYITSERKLPEEFEPYRIPIPPQHIHQLLYFANLYVGDSQTMATEAAVLGTPSIRSNTFTKGDDMSNFVNLEENYGLLRSIENEDEAVATAINWIETPELQEKWDDRREQLFVDTIDVTEYIIEQIREVAK